MGVIRRLIRFLNPPHKPLPNHGGRLISSYRMQDAEADEKLLVMAGLARSPEDARWLIQRRGGASVDDILKGSKRRRGRKKHRWHTLLMRLDGHDPHTMKTIYEGGRYDEPRLKPQYRYRGRL